MYSSTSKGLSLPQWEWLRRINLSPGGCLIAWVNRAMLGIQCWSLPVADWHSAVVVGRLALGNESSCCWAHTYLHSCHSGHCLRGHWVDQWLDKETHWYPHNGSFSLLFTYLLKSTIPLLRSLLFVSMDMKHKRHHISLHTQRCLCTFPLSGFLPPISQSCCFLLQVIWPKL